MLTRHALKTCSSTASSFLSSLLLPSLSYFFTVSLIFFCRSMSSQKSVSLSRSCQSWSAQLRVNSRAIMVLTVNFLGVLCPLLADILTGHPYTTAIVTDGRHRCSGGHCLLCWPAEGNVGAAVRQLLRPLNQLLSSSVSLLIVCVASRSF